MKYQVKDAVNRCSEDFAFCSTVCRTLSLLILLGGLPMQTLHGSEPSANVATQQREAAANWLRLESDRKTYEATHPAATPRQSRQLDMHLRQQRQRDRQDLVRERQASSLARQQQRLERNTPGMSSPGRKSRNRRLGERLRLQNRLQRNGWPRR